MVQIKKSSKNKYYDSKGKLLPGSTTVLSVLNKPALIEWAWKLGKDDIDYKKVRDVRASIGTCVHDCIEAILLSKPLPDISKFSSKDTEIILKAIENFNLWYLPRKKDIEILEVECVMSSDIYGFGGTNDLLMKYKGVVTLCDFKTSKAVYEEHKIQQCSYKLLLEEKGYTIDKIMLLQVNEFGVHETYINKTYIPLYTKIFLACLEIYKAQRALGAIDKNIRAKSSKYKNKIILPPTEF